MFRVLIVEDNPGKAREVRDLLIEDEGLDDQDLEFAADVKSALSLLAGARYDLLVLDVAIPQREGGEVLRDGGLRLLEEVQRRKKFNVPTQIVAVTAFDEILLNTRENFERSGVLLVKYDAGDPDWKRTLRSIVARMLEEIESRADVGAEFRSDACVVCALADPELAAMLNLPYDWHELAHAGDPCSYWEGTVVLNGQKRRVIAAAASEMGQAASAVMASKMIEIFRPRMIAMVGIAAGIPGRVELGDVVVADPTWEYAAGKLVNSVVGTEFEQLPRQLALDPFLRQRVEKICLDPLLAAQCRTEYPSAPPDGEPVVHRGALATGPYVVASEEYRNRLNDQHRKLLAIDMEMYGVYVAGELAREPRPTVLGVKGICDFADSNKSDSCQHYAAFMAAHVFRLILEAQYPS